MDDEYDTWHSMAYHIFSLSFVRVVSASWGIVVNEWGRAWSSFAFFALFLFLFFFLVVVLNCCGCDKALGIPELSSAYYHRSVSPIDESQCLCQKIWISRCWISTVANATLWSGYFRVRAQVQNLSLSCDRIRPVECDYQQFGDLRMATQKDL